MPARLINNIMMQINRHQGNIGYAKLGIVSSSNPQNSTIKVTLQPEQVEAGPMPYCTPWIGWYAPPNAGDQCLVIFQEGNKNVPVGALLLYWDNAVPPSGLALGEAIWKHSSGSFIKLSNDGKVTINGNVEIDITAPKVVITTTGDTDINANGDVNIVTMGDTNITATGDANFQASQITLSNGGSTDGVPLFTTLKSYIDSHIHSGVTTGSGNSGPPVTPLSSSVESTIVMVE